MGGIPNGWQGWQSGPASFSVCVPDALVVAGDIEDALRESIRRQESVLQQMREELAVEVEAKGQRDQMLKRHRERKTRAARPKPKVKAKAKAKAKAKGKRR
jgi:hypothetical protein